MSNNINDQLYDLTGEMLEYWTGTMWERVIQRDLDAKDLDALRYHVNEAYKEYCIQEDALSA